MRTVIFAYYHHSESYYEALHESKEQSLDLMRSYKVKPKRITVCDLDECRG